MEEDYTAGVKELGDVMESSEMDCTKPGPHESCSGGPILQLEQRALHQIVTLLSFTMIFSKLLS